MTTTTTTTSPPPTASPSPPSASDDNNNLLHTIHLLLGSKLRVTMTDGRIARGNFVCLDRLGNIILDNVVEHRKVAHGIPPPPPPPPTGGADDDDDDDSTNDDGGNETNNNQRVYKKWDTERALSQAVIPGDRLAKVEIARTEWEDRVCCWTK